MPLGYKKKQVFQDKIGDLHIIRYYFFGLFSEPPRNDNLKWSINITMAVWTQKPFTPQGQGPRGVKTSDFSYK